MTKKDQGLECGEAQPHFPPCQDAEVTPSWCLLPSRAVLDVEFSSTDLPTLGIGANGGHHNETFPRESHSGVGTQDKPRREERMAIRSCQQAAHSFSSLSEQTRRTDGWLKKNKWAYTHLAPPWGFGA